MKRFVCMFIGMALLLAGAGVARADDDFNPDNPPEPAASYKLSVTAEPSAVGAVSGKGRYKEGTRVTVRTSSLDSDYRFSHWLLDGKVHTTATSFTYTMPAKDVDVVAVYEFVPFDPANPSEPGANYKRIVYVTGDPVEACSFNINSGTRYVQGTVITVTAYANQGFDFVGWYCDDVEVATTRSFTYTVPEYTSTLVARFAFNPDSPGDPDGVIVPGDINGDFMVDVKDMQRLVIIMTDVGESETTGDLNGDGIVDALDLQHLLNIMTESK